MAGWFDVYGVVGGHDYCLLRHAAVEQLSAYVEGEKEEEDGGAEG